MSKRFGLLRLAAYAIPSWKRERFGEEIISTAIEAADDGRWGAAREATGLLRLGLRYRLIRPGPIASAWTSWLMVTGAVLLVVAGLLPSRLWTALNVLMILDSGGVRMLPLGPYTFGRAALLAVGLGALAVAVTARRGLRPRPLAMGTGVVVVALSVQSFFPEPVYPAVLGRGENGFGLVTIGVVALAAIVFAYGARAFALFTAMVAVGTLLFMQSARIDWAFSAHSAFLMDPLNFKPGPLFTAVAVAILVVATLFRQPPRSLENMAEQPATAGG